MCVAEIGDLIWVEIDDFRVSVYAGKCVCDGWSFVCVCVAEIW